MMVNNNSKVPNRKTVKVHDLLDILYKKLEFPKHTFDEVYPGILLGDAEAAKNTKHLKESGITHVLNAAGGTLSPMLYILTGPQYYEERDFPCNYLGLPMLDTETFPINEFFNEGADFIEEALENDGRILVHCRQGVSRSATIVIAYLMIKKQMSVIDACQMIRNIRAVLPNKGFLQQLCELHATLWMQKQNSEPAQEIPTELIKAR